MITMCCKVVSEARNQNPRTEKVGVNQETEQILHWL